jgi:phosphatidylserine/phosphatidylglycerophosphate/cardiolipin synthase-like enzyme
MSPMLVRSGAFLESLDDIDLGSLELVNRGCKLLDYSKKAIKKIEPFDISEEMIAYASPDSTYAVTKRLMDAAKKSIRIGIYDFTAGYMKDILLNAMHRGVKVTLMLDLDGATGEDKIFDDLGKFGCRTVAAPSCATRHKKPFFRSSHEKFIIIDNQWVLVQSGNYSKASIPLNEKDGGDKEHFVKGNRDMGVAIRSAALCAFFSKVLDKDVKLELGEGALESVEAARRERAGVDLIEAVPKLLPTKLFPSKSFKPASPVSILPILTPDNYMKEIPSFLKEARSSIFIEQQYIHSQDDAVVELLSAIRAAMDVAQAKGKTLDVRIVLGKVFGGEKGLAKETKNQENIRKRFGLKLGANIRFIDTKRFIHCHNKLIIIDNRSVLISSQNWSNAAVRENREAGLLIRLPEMARYFASIFASDWEVAQKKLPAKAEPESVALEAVSADKFMEVNLGDYVQF